MGIQPPRYDVSVPEAPRVMAWQDEVAKSIAQATSIEPQRASAQTAPAASAPSQVVFNQIITTSAPPVVVTRVRAEEPKPSDEIGTITFVGTVLGMYISGVPHPNLDCTWNSTVVLREWPEAFAYFLFPKHEF